MAATAFLGLAHTFKHGEMIRVGLLSTVSATSPAIMSRSQPSLSHGFIGFFAWHAAVMTWQSHQSPTFRKAVIAVPLWIPQLGYSVAS